MLQSLKGAAHGRFISSVNHNTCQALWKQKGLSTLLLLPGIRGRLGGERWGWSWRLLSWGSGIAPAKQRSPARIVEAIPWQRRHRSGCEESTANPAELTVLVAAVGRAAPGLPNGELSPCACHDKSAAARLNNSIH